MEYEIFWILFNILLPDHLSVFFNFLGCSLKFLKKLISFLIDSSHGKVKIKRLIFKGWYSLDYDIAFLVILSTLLSFLALFCRPLVLIYPLVVFISQLVVLVCLLIIHISLPPVVDWNLKNLYRNLLIHFIYRQLQF